MKQILQSLKTGETVLEDIPCPQIVSGSLLIETTHTLVSAGTERMLLEFGKANFLGKIKQQPDKVKMVLDKVKTDGLFTTLDAVKAKLDQPIPLGYCNVGKVLEIGEAVSGFTVGDRVVSNGNHAEIVRVPKNLCAKIPENVTDEQAVFTVLGAIALQGIRLSQPTLGENYVVIGLGLIGLVAVQILRANGCRVLGVDLDSEKCELAKQFGAETVCLTQGADPIAHAEQFSRGYGVDAVIITASTKSSEPLHQAATMCRKRGRIVLIGVIGNEISRADFYEKELTFQVSCSYGPGRYDEGYEKKGQDYPIAFVRWTEQRNFEAVLDMMSSGTLDVSTLVSHRFQFEQAIEAYSILETEKSSLGILLNYPEADPTAKRKASVNIEPHISSAVGQINVGFIGSGNYAARVLAPAFKKTKANLVSVVSSQGISGKLLAKKLGFAKALTNADEVYQDKTIDTIAIATRHNLHAQQVCAALDAGKHVFVEKPLAITLAELASIEACYQKSNDKLLMVGFNRRFAPQIKIIKKLLTAESAAKSFIYTVNAGEIPAEHWTQDMSIGGGRIIGEACHFIDLLRFLADSKICQWTVASVKTVADTADDKVTIVINFEDGSLGTIHYLANGHKSFPKERLEVFCQGKILQLDNFRKLEGFGWQGFKKNVLRKQNKGQDECAQVFVDAIKKGGVAPISFEELMEVSKVSIQIAEQLRT